MDELYLYDDYDDTISVKSNKIVKPLKGGFQFHWDVREYGLFSAIIIEYSIWEGMLDYDKNAKQKGQIRTLKIIEEIKKKT